MNAYEMREVLRNNIGEGTAVHWSNKILTKRLNECYLEVGRLVVDSPGDWLLKKSDSITPSLNRLTLPSDCLRPAYVEEVGSGRKIWINGSVREREGELISTGSSALLGMIRGYLLGNYIEIDSPNYGEACYVWYQPRLVELACGTCQTGTDATHVAFNQANWPSGEDDYYNGLTLHVRDVTSNVLNVNTIITDYVGSTGIATVASAVATPAATDFYGTVPQIPRELLDLVITKATVKSLARPNSTFEKEIFAFWKSLLKDAEEQAQDFLAARLSGSSYVRVVED